MTHCRDFRILIFVLSLFDKFSYDVSICASYWSFAQSLEYVL